MSRTTLRIMPKLNTKTLSRHIQHMTKETLRPLPNVLPHPTTMCSSNSFSAPATIAFPIFGGYELMPQVCVTSFPKHQSHFPSKSWLNNPILRIPKPFASTGHTTFSQATSEYLNTSVDLPHRKFLYYYYWIEWIL